MKLWRPAIRIRISRCFFATFQMKLCQYGKSSLLTLQWVVECFEAMLPGQCFFRINRTFIIVCAGIALTCSKAPGQEPSEVGRAFIDLRNDSIRYNCTRATYWLYKHRDTLHEQMLAELYRATDPQARDSLLLVLFQTKTFTPDERFARFIAQRLREEDTRVPNSRFQLPQADYDRTVPPADNLFFSAHSVAWFYIDSHYDLFEPVLKLEIGSTDDMWELWGIAWLMKKRGRLANSIELFTPEVFRKAAANLKDDDKAFNASEAARFFLLLPDQGLPFLREIQESADRQQRSLARALIDAIATGNRDAFGFINSKCHLTTGLMGISLAEPDWVTELTFKYEAKDEYP